MNPIGLPLTERARRVLLRADAERDRLQHEVLTAQHLTWALLAEKGCVAILVLKELSFDPLLLEKHLGSGWQATGPARNSDEDAMAAAVQSARRLGHSCVDTAHLLLGVLRGGSRVSKFLHARGVSYTAAAAATDRFLTPAGG
jgi:ATP-dependent Clp protease ATP-binding subunit ClpA